MIIISMEQGLLFILGELVLVLVAVKCKKAHVALHFSQLDDLIPSTGNSLLKTCPVPQTYRGS